MNLDDQWEALPRWLTDLDPDVYKDASYVVLDFETTNLHYGHWRVPENNIVCANWRVVNGRGHSRDRKIYGNEFEMGDLVMDCNRATFIVAHNAQFELGWLNRCGYLLGSQPIFCTQIAEHVLSGNRGWRTGLNECLGRRGWDGKLDVVGKMISAGICPSTIPRSWLQKYCGVDVSRTHDLFLDQLATLDKDGLLPVAFCRFMLTPVLADLSTVGMRLDEENVQVLFEEKSREVALLDAEFSKLTDGVNPKSGKQMRELLYEKMGFEPAKDYRGEPITTPKGDLATSTLALSALKAKTKAQKEFVLLRNKLVKARDSMSKYIGHFHRCIEETEDNTLYAEFNQARTQTHRLSSTGAMGYNIQFQNIDNNFKPAITVRDPDYLLSEADYAQLEYRAAVDMANDEAGLYDILSGVDSHGFTANIVFAKEWQRAREEANSEATYSIRRKAKAHTFKPLYGGSSGTKAQQKYYKAFKAKHKGITAWQEDNKAEVLRTGSLRIPSGLVFYWPDARVTPTGYVTNTANICNYPVQSFATADIVPIGVTFCWHRLQVSKLRSFMVNTVHDSIISEVHKEEKEEYEAIAQQSMVTDALYTLDKLYDYKFKTPLEVDSEYYKNWGQKYGG